MLQVVIDTNVLVAALRSRRGASFQLLSTLGRSTWQPNLSTALLLEYEAVLKRETRRLQLPLSISEAIIDRLCAVGKESNIYYRWRRLLPDPNDDFLLELAIGCKAHFLITHNISDLAPARQFGLGVLTPGEFLRRI